MIYMSSLQTSGKWRQKLTTNTKEGGAHKKQAFFCKNSKCMKLWSLLMIVEEI